MENKVNIPQGTTVEEIKVREQIIRNFYQEWKVANQTQRRYNVSLKEYINIRQVSIVETSEHAAKTYLSTLAVLQLDAILTNAIKVRVVPAKADVKNQKPFNKMIIMEYCCVGIGMVKMTVGINRRSLEKVQYCITRIDVDRETGYK